MVNMNYKEEYDKYIKNFEDCRSAIISDSSYAVSEALCVLSGTRFRVGQILAEFSIYYAKAFDKFKVEDITDKKAKECAKLSLFEQHKVGIDHWDKMYKDLDSLEKSLKKRLMVLGMEV